MSVKGVCDGLRERPDMGNRFVLLLLVWLSLWLSAAAQAPRQNATLPSGFFEWTLDRPDGSVLVAFSNVLEFSADRPLAVWMQGSGYHSLFLKRGEKVSAGPLSLVSEALGEDIQVVAVEKRGVPFGLVGSGGAGEAPEEYHRFATLDDRADDVLLLLRALGDSGRLSPRLLAIGHSEGADVAARVAARSEKVSHLAFLAGGGASQLFDFHIAIRKSEGTPEEKEAEIDLLWREWAEVKSDPSSTTRMFMGHAFRRWSSYLAHPPLESLLASRAHLLIVHGSEDRSVPIESADLAAVELDRAGRPFEYLRLPGADHSLRTPTQTSPPFLSLGLILRRFFLGEG